MSSRCATKTGGAAIDTYWHGITDNLSTNCPSLRCIRLEAGGLHSAVLGCYLTVVELALVMVRQDTVRDAGKADTIKLTRRAPIVHHIRIATKASGPSALEAIVCSPPRPG
jgi:hypothetical protein